MFVVSHLLKNLWRRHLGQNKDVMFTDTVGDNFWSNHQHEPLIIGAILPLSHAPDHRGPWVVKGSRQT